VDKAATPADVGALRPMGSDEGDLYHTLFRTMPESFVVWRLVRDTEGTARDLLFVGVNEALRNLLGLPTDPTGRPMSEEDPGYRERKPDMLAVCARVAATGQPETHQGYFPAMARWFQARLSKVTDDLVLAAVSDVTDHRQAQQRLERLQHSLDQMEDYPTWSDSEGRIIEVSESTCRHLEYTRDELLQMTIFDISPETDREAWANSWKNLRPPKSLRMESQHRTKSGRLYPVELVITAMLFEGQEYHCTYCRDISDRRRLEEFLRLTQTSVDHAPDMILWLDPDGRVAYANHAACARLGYSREELQEMHIWEIGSSTPEEFHERWRATGGVGSLLFEEVYTAKDGREYEVEIAATSRFHGDRQVGLAFVRDISEWKQAQRSLRDSEERYRQLFELESDAILLTEEGSGAIIEANEAACSLYGYGKTELLSMRDDELFFEAPPPGPDSDTFTDELASGWHRRKDGTVFPVEMRGHRFELKGQGVQVTTVRDVSERKQIADELEQSRRMLRQVLDAVPLRIAWKDRELRHLGCNLPAALARGLPDPLFVIGRKDEELPLYNTNEQCRVDDREVIESGMPKLQYEETAVTPDGETLMMRTSKVPLRGRSGDVIGVLGVHENITEQVAIRRALKERDEQLRQSQKMEAVGRLAGGIAHDFNNVLTTIIGYSDLILSSPDCTEGPTAEDIREIKAAAERAAGLTGRILAFSRRQALQPALLSLNTIVSDTERLLARTLGADILLRTSLSPDLGQVEIDEHQFVQVLLNLAVNARDAMPDGGVLAVETANVELDQRFCETHPDAHPGPHVVLSVSDTGTGMDADTMAHAFEPFYTTKPPGLGTGLGLSTVYGVVAQSGGYTYVRSEPGQGTTFTICLPRVQTEAASQGSEASPAEDAAPQKTIMVVDDDATFLGLAVRILEKRGYQVLPAHNGQEAIAMLGDPAISVDALITDVALPGPQQGDKVAAFASAGRPGLPVLFMSVQPRDRMVQEGKLSQQATYLEKPFTAEGLIGLLRTSLGET
jgi:two-component system cell cycle sensor histidine kinase/response regulator CckA